MMTKASGAGENAKADELSYEQARDELAKVVAQLEQGSVTLEESMTLWERGEALAQICEQRLTGAREKFDRVVKKAEDS